MTVQLRWPLGVTGQIFVSWLYPRKIRELFVIGSKGSRIFSSSRPSKANPLRAELEHFIGCIERNVQPITDAEDGLQVVRVLTACQLSMETEGTWTKV